MKISLKTIALCFNILKVNFAMQFPEWKRDDAHFQATLRSFFAERAVTVQPEFLLQN
jgi:hypothetical protein